MSAKLIPHLTHTQIVEYLRAILAAPDDLTRQALLLALTATNAPRTIQHIMDKFQKTLELVMQIDTISEVAKPAIIDAGPVPTMSSREIATVCEKRHDHILRDIEKMLQDIGAPISGASSFEHEYITAQNKRAKEYRLPKDLTMTLITGYRADLRYKVIKRVEELEARGAALPDFNNPAIAARAWADQVETVHKQSAQITTLSIDSDALGRISAADGSFCITDTAKALQMRPKDLFGWLQAHHWIYRRAGGSAFLGYSAKIKSGFLEHKVTTVTRSDGSERVTEQVRVTGKGMSKLAGVM